MFSFHHVALSVKELNRSIEFYQYFGFNEVMRWQADDATLEIAHLKSGDALLEFFCFQKPEEPNLPSPSLEQDLPRVGIKHFGLKTADIQKTKAQLEAKGFADDIKITQGRTGISYFFIRDPDDHFVEIVEDNRVFE